MTNEKLREATGLLYECRDMLALYDGRHADLYKKVWEWCRANRNAAVTTLTSNVRADPEMDLSWQTWLTHRDRLPAEVYNIARSAFVASWAAARSHDNETGESRATADVVAERRRQVDDEGWDAEHDDQYQNSGQMAQAAAAYALRASPAQYNHAHDLWPWSDEWWKPKDVRRDLVRAAALIIAEIERLDRHSQKALEQWPKSIAGEAPFCNCIAVTGQCAGWDEANQSRLLLQPGERAGPK